MQGVRSQALPGVLEVNISQKIRHKEPGGTLGPPELEQSPPHHMSQGAEGSSPAQGGGTGRIPWVILQETVIQGCTEQELPCPQGTHSPPQLQRAIEPQKIPSASLPPISHCFEPSASSPHGPWSPVSPALICPCLFTQENRLTPITGFSLPA